METGGRVDRATKIAILERLIRDAGLSASERLAAIAAHSKYVERDEGDRAAPDPAVLVQWLADPAEPRDEAHLRDVLRILGTVYRVSLARVGEIAAESMIQYD